MPRWGAPNGIDVCPPAPYYGAQVDPIMGLTGVSHQIDVARDEGLKLLDLHLIWIICTYRTPGWFFCKSIHISTNRCGLVEFQLHVILLSRQWEGFARGVCSIRGLAGWAAVCRWGWEENNNIYLFGNHSFVKSRLHFWADYSIWFENKLDSENRTKWIFALTRHS